MQKSSSSFAYVWSDIEGRGLTDEVRERYGRSLLGVVLSQDVDAWVTKNLFELGLSSSPVELLTEVWPFLDSSPITEKLRRLEPPVARKALVEKWLLGDSFKEILAAVKFSGGYIRQGQQKRLVTTDAIVGFCQNELAFQACLLLNAIAAAYDAIHVGDATDVVDYFDELGKLMKYGLPTEEAAAVYESGFADRVLCQKIAALLPPKTIGQGLVKTHLRLNANSINGLLEGYPSYFKTVMTSVTR